MADIKKILFFAFILVHTFAQKNTIRQNIYWLRYYNQFSLNKNLTWQNEFENRRFIEGNVQHLFITHSRLHFQFSKRADVAMGFTYLLQSPNVPETAVSRLIVPEFRPVQEVNWTDPILTRLTLSHRIRVDERFVRKASTIALLDGYDFNLRFRYRLMLSYPLSKVVNPLTLRYGHEIFLNAGEQIVYNQFDQFRTIVSLEKRLNKHFSTELSYIHWYQQRSTGTDFFNRNIARLTLIHRI